MLDLARVAGVSGPPVAGFSAYEPMGGSIVGGYDYYLGTNRRNQMLELHFDADQGCFLGQPAGSAITITFAQKAPDEN